MKRPWLHSCAVFLAVCILVLVITGTFVSSNEYRPLYSVGRIHPWAGAVIGVLTFGFALWLTFTEQRRWMVRLGWAAVGVFIVEALLGLPMRPQPFLVSFSHTLLAYLLFTTSIAIAVFTSRGWHRGPELVEQQRGRPLRSLTIVACAAVVAQVVLGAAFRYGAGNVLPHILGAMVVAALSGVLGFLAQHRFPQHRSLQAAGVALMAITFSQVILGMAVLTIQVINPEDPLPVMLLISAHVSTGAMTLAASAVLAIQVHHNVRETVLNTEESKARISNLR